MANITDRAANFRVTFIERTEKTYNNSILYVKLSYNGKTKKKSLGVSVMPKTLDKKRQIVKGNEEVSLYIQQTEANLKSEFASRKVANKPIDLDSILNTVLRNETEIERLPTIKIALEMVEEKFKETLKSGNCISKSYKKNMLNLDKFKRFIEHEFKTLETPFNAITAPIAEKLATWLQTKYGVGSATVKRCIQIGRNIYRIAQSNQWHAYNPFEHVKAPKEENTNIDKKLTHEELKRLEALELNVEVYQIVRDTFIFCCYTGLSFSDVKNLTKKEIEGQILRKSRNKTKAKFAVYLLPKAVELLQKYDNSNAILCFPTYANAQHNRVLKELALMAEIPKEVATHYARKTFAQLMIQLGISPKALQLALGHSKMSITEGYYANTSEERTINEMKKLENLLM